MPQLEAPWYPIIDVRGYAGTAHDVDETVADPGMGFHLGPTKFRRLWTGRLLQNPRFDRLGISAAWSTKLRGHRPCPR